MGKGRVENLKPFPRGTSGNPGGRPKLLSDAYRAWLAAVNPNDPQRRTNAELIAAGQGVAAIGGQTAAAREIRQATEGDEVSVTLRRKSADEMSDDELAAVIVDGGAARGGSGTAEEKTGA